MQYKEIIFVICIINNCELVLSCLGFDFQFRNTVKAYLSTTRRLISHAWVPLMLCPLISISVKKKIFIVLFRRLSFLFELYKVSIHCNVLLCGIVAEA